MLNLKILPAFLILFFLNSFACSQQNSQTGSEPVKEIPEEEATIIEQDGPVDMSLLTGAQQPDAFLPLIEGKKVALVVNQTSTIAETHLVDRLLSVGVDIQTIFAPEHGFRGTADAGAQIKDGKDAKTGIPLISLYGKKKKPLPSDLKGLDYIVFDIQDVGARFYTYISSMSYVMEACAENGVSFIVLDRPNPNGHYVDGPVLKDGFSSFVGLHNIPVVHGMTVGEYAQMVNGEGWLKGNVQCDLTVVKCKNYDHQTFYSLPIKPSPNLPNMQSIYLYPSLCFFEGTVVSIGRGTNKQFQVIGHPDYKIGSFTFIPKPMEGAQNPKLNGVVCTGVDLSSSTLESLRAEKQLNLNYLIDFYQVLDQPNSFFLKNNFIDKLAGSSQLREQIKSGMSADEIRASWQDGIAAFKKVRNKYLLYPE